MTTSDQIQLFIGVVASGGLILSIVSIVVSRITAVKQRKDSYKQALYTEDKNPFSVVIRKLNNEYHCRLYRDDQQSHTWHWRIYELKPLP